MNGITLTEVQETKLPEAASKRILLLLVWQHIEVLPKKMPIVTQGSGGILGKTSKYRICNHFLLPDSLLSLPPSVQQSPDATEGVQKALLTTQFRIWVLLEREEGSGSLAPASDLKYCDSHPVRWCSSSGLCTQKFPCAPRVPSHQGAHSERGAAWCQACVQMFSCLASFLLTCPSWNYIRGSLTFLCN